MNQQQIDDVAYQRSQAEEILANTQSSEDKARAHVNLGIACEHERNWEAAIEHYTQALANHPEDRQVHYLGNNNKAFSLIQMKRFDEAEEYCEAAIKVDPDRHNAHKNLALVYQGQGRWLDAAFSFATAYRNNPRDPRAWQFLSQLLSARPDLLAQSESLRQEIDSLRQMIDGSGCTLSN